MDTEQLITHGRSRFEHAAARRLLREKYQAKLVFAHADGMWRAGPELIAVLQACPDESAVIADLYDSPIKIQVSDLLMLVQQRWQEQMWAWLIEHDQLSKNR